MQCGCLEADPYVTAVRLGAERGDATQHAKGQTACGLPVRPRTRLAHEEPGTADFLGLSDDENDPYLANRLPGADSGTTSQLKTAAETTGGQVAARLDDVDRCTECANAIAPRSCVTRCCTAIAH